MLDQGIIQKSDLIGLSEINIIHIIFLVVLATSYQIGASDFFCNGANHSKTDIHVYEKERYRLMARKQHHI